MCIRDRDRAVHETAYRADKVGRWGVRETRQNYQKAKTGIENFKKMCIRDSLRGADEKSDCRKNTSPKKDKNKY